MMPAARAAASVTDVIMRIDFVVGKDPRVKPCDVCVANSVKDDGSAVVRSASAVLVLAAVVVESVAAVLVLVSVVVESVFAVVVLVLETPVVE